ncbi:MAG: hypothetical protein WA057_03270 [Candidatus Magasanikiibacteriota bacterium]
MLYNDYNWKAKYEHDDPKITGEPDSSLLSRHEGYEMLYFINKFAEIHSLKQVNTCQRIEELIRKKLPSDIRSQIKVKEWLETNWDK